MPAARRDAPASASRLLWRWTIAPVYEALALALLVLRGGANPWYAFAAGFALLCVLWSIGRIAEMILSP